MAKRQPLNNRINKEDMFKKIMPSASARPKAAERPAPAGDGEMMNGLTDDLIDMTVSSFGDDLLDQLPSQPRVFATPAAPTAPVPPPPTVSLPRPEEPYQAQPPQAPSRQTQPPASGAQYAPPQPQAAELIHPPQAQAAPPAPQPPASAEFPPPAAQPPSDSTRQQSPADFPQPRQEPGPGPQPPQEWEQPRPYAPEMPFAPMAQQPPYFPAQSPPAPGYVPTQPYAPYPGQFPTGYPYPQYPQYPPYGYPPEAQQPPAAPASEPAGEDSLPVIEKMPSATVLADSASVVTDTVVIQENNPSGAPARHDPAPEPPVPRETPPPKAPEPELPQETPHPFQPEMMVEDVHLIDDYDAFPPLAEEKGDVVNVVEQIVSMWVDDAIRSIHGCGCEKCRLDVAAYALNRLQPKYVLAEDLSEEMIYRRQTVAEAVGMLTKAAFQVKTFPRH